MGEALEPWGEPEEAPCRECGGWKETLLYWMENALEYDRPQYEIVEPHPCPYCAIDES